MGSRRCWALGACALVCAALWACGARTGLDVLGDASAPGDATTDHASSDAHPDSPFVPDAGKDVAVPDASVLCDNGYFVEVTDNVGTQIWKDGCQGANVPKEACVGHGEDCVTNAVQGCTDGGAISLAFNGCSCSAIQIGNAQLGETTFRNPGLSFGQANIDVKGIGATAITGDYDTTVTSLDGGATRHLHGAFCVEP